MTRATTILVLALATCLWSSRATATPTCAGTNNNSATSPHAITLPNVTAGRTVFAIMRTPSANAVNSITSANITWLLEANWNINNAGASRARGARGRVHTTNGSTETITITADAAVNVQAVVLECTEIADATRVGVAAGEGDAVTTSPDLTFTSMSGVGIFIAGITSFTDATFTPSDGSYTKPAQATRAALAYWVTNSGGTIDGIWTMGSSDIAAISAFFAGEAAAGSGGGNRRLLLGIGPPE